MDKWDRAAIFRQRLETSMQDAGWNRSSLARATRVDRSTLSQLLAAGETRLPNAQLVADCAATLGVSSDWLLGLTDMPERPGDLVAASMGLTTARRTSVDDQMLDWHREARGHKIRHVPATLPDILKTPDMLAWEYESFLGKTPDQAIAATVDRLDLLRAGDSDYEIALPLHELTSFARSDGYYQGLPVRVRKAQLSALSQACRDLYPSLRLFLFDARKLFSAPVTVFGPLLAVVYVGQFYLAFRSQDRVRSMIQHFDGLVRECTVDSRDVADWLDAL